MPIVLKFGSLNLLEPSGPAQVFNGIALPLQDTPILVHMSSGVARVFGAQSEQSQCPPLKKMCELSENGDNVVTVLLFGSII